MLPRLDVASADGRRHAPGLGDGGDLAEALEHDGLGLDAARLLSGAVPCARGGAGAGWFAARLLATGARDAGPGGPGAASHDRHGVIERPCRGIADIRGRRGRGGGARRLAPFAGRSVDAAFIVTPNGVADAAILAV